MVSKIVFLVFLMTTSISMLVTLTFTQGWNTNEAIATYTHKTTIRVHAMRWKFTICHLWITTAKRNPLGVD